MPGRRSSFCCASLAIRLRSNWRCTFSVETEPSDPVALLRHWRGIEMVIPSGLLKVGTSWSKYLLEGLQLVSSYPFILLTTNFRYQLEAEVPWTNFTDADFQGIVEIHLYLSGWPCRRQRRPWHSIL